MYHFEWNCLQDYYITKIVSSHTLLQVLHFLSAMKPADVVVHLLPLLLHSSIVNIISNGE